MLLLVRFVESQSVFLLSLPTDFPKFLILQSRNNGVTALVNSILQNSTAANSTATCNATIANFMTQNSTVQSNGTVVHVQVNLTNICESNRRKSLSVCNGTALNLTKHCEVAKTGNLPLVCRNGSVINSSSIATSNNIILEIAQSKVQFLRLTLQQRRHQFIL